MAGGEGGRGVGFEMVVIFNHEHHKATIGGGGKLEIKMTDLPADKRTFRANTLFKAGGFGGNKTSGSKEGGEKR